LVGCAVIDGITSGLSVGRSGDWFLDESSATNLTVLSGKDYCLCGGATRMVDGGNAPSRVWWAGVSGPVDTGSGLQGKVDQ